MSYAVHILRSAQKQLSKINRMDQARIISAIRELANDPRPLGNKKLSGRQAWRIRIGVYRVIYEIHDQDLVVLVIEVGHRQEIYR